ncbi:MAG: hypothetical protein NTX87_09955 [Planctomycetota bacterium]|nr:hypothetical protein [Planctomycetota bacterium]
MSANEAYRTFIHELRDWLIPEVAHDAALSHMVNHAQFDGQGDWMYILNLTPDERPRIRLSFRQNMVTHNPQSKVFALEIDLIGGLTPELIESRAYELMPIGDRGVFRRNGREQYYIQVPWGHGREYDRLRLHSVRDSLYGFALQSIRFARRAVSEDRPPHAGSRR